MGKFWQLHSKIYSSSKVLDELRKQRLQQPNQDQHHHPKHIWSSQYIPSKVGLIEDDNFWMIEKFWPYKVEQERHRENFKQILFFSHNVSHWPFSDSRYLVQRECRCPIVAVDSQTLFWGFKEAQKLLANDGGRRKDVRSGGQFQKRIENPNGRAIYIIQIPINRKAIAEVTRQKSA